MLSLTLGLALAATLLIEIITCFCRFCLGRRSREFAPRYSRFTFGVRIHHGYVGVALIPPAALVPAIPLAQAALLALGAGMVVSDLIHHFIVLPLATGEFD